MSDLAAEAKAFRGAFQAITEQVATRIIGQENVVRTVLFALFSGGHVLLEGVPGLGKTLLVQTVAQSIGAAFKRIQCTPDLMPADVLGTRIARVTDGGQREFFFEEGPIFADVVLADEINRATPKSQSAMLEAMQEGAVTIAGERRLLPDLFFVLATQNPIDMEGTYPLPEAQLDRFLFKVLVESPGVDDLREIARRTTGARPDPVEAVLAPEDVLRFRRLLASVPLSPSAEQLAAELVHGSHPSRGPERLRRFVRYGASPRGVQALVRAARAEALLDDRYVVDTADVRAWALPSLRHRLILGVEADLEEITADALLADLLAATPDPD